jgi:tetratricopeptide (TPR) repeat protein
MNKIIKIIAAIVLPFIVTSCSKDWLDAKPTQSLVVPTTLKDIQGLLDNTILFNSYQPSFSELGTDNYFLTDEEFEATYESDRNIYLWASSTNFYGGIETTTLYEWDNVYLSIYTCNIALEQLAKIPVTTSNATTWSTIRGRALFYRAYAYYNLSQLYCKPYDKATASQDQGLILRTSSNRNLPSTRASIEETYALISNDLSESTSLLPGNTLYPTSPVKAAALAMLSRVYLSMGEYVKAGKYADSTLKINSTLMDYNSIDASSDTPFPLYTPETIYYSWALGSPILPVSGSSGSVDTTLYNAYSNDDLRKTVFFRTDGIRILFKGCYSMTYDYTFNGLATDEILLNRAECYARQGEAAKAISDLNSLLQKRYITGTFVNLEATTAQEALTKILFERRKELCFRELRWTDLRRLNKDNNTKTTLKRVINTQTHKLEPNDNKYVYPIPNNEILRSGVAQNPR